jgi:hypothetical protein
MGDHHFQVSQNWPTNHWWPLLFSFSEFLSFFQPEKYGFQTYKGYWWKKMTLIRQILENKIKCQTFTTSSSSLPKYKSILWFFYVHIWSILGQIWRNLLVGDCQFWYITKLKKNASCWWQWDYINLKLLPSWWSIKIDTCYNWRCRIKYTAVMLEIDE